MNEEKSYVLNVNENAARYLYRVAQWSKFFAILGFIAAALMLLASLSMFAFGSFMPFMTKGMPMQAGLMPFAMGAVFGIIYIPFSVLYFIVSLKLYRFAEKAKSALKHNSDDLLEESLKNLSAYTRILGIITVVVLSLYALIIVFGLLFGLGAMLMH